MYQQNVKHECGHWIKWELYGTSRTCGPYVLALRKTRCFRCLASRTRLSVVREIQDEMRPIAA